MFENTGGAPGEFEMNADAFLAYFLEVGHFDWKGEAIQGLKKGKGGREVEGRRRAGSSGSGGKRVVDTYGAADDDGAESVLFGGDLGVFLLEDGETGGIGVGDRAFDNWIDISEIASNDTLLHEVKASSSDASGAWISKDVVGGWLKVVGGPDEVESGWVFIGFGGRIDDGLKVDDFGIAVVMGDVEDEVGSGDSDRAEFISESID